MQTEVKNVLIPAMLPTTKLAIVGWSGGKDSVLSLYRVLQERRFKPVALVTTITREYERVSMHGVRTSIVELQAQEIGIPLHKVFISKGAGNLEYEDAMVHSLMEFKGMGVEHIIFGDIFLRDIREYREEKICRPTGLSPIFPLWGEDTKRLADEFIQRGFHAIITTIDLTKLAENFVGREYDRELMSEIPPEVDPCGENGEFHTLVYDGPILKHPILLKRGITRKDGNFMFIDLLP